jgi:hypothetical protein
LCENLADFSQSHSQVEFLNNWNKNIGRRLRDGFIILKSFRSNLKFEK